VTNATDLLRDLLKLGAALGAGDRRAARRQNADAKRAAAAQNQLVRVFAPGSQPGVQRNEPLLLDPDAEISLAGAAIHAKLAVAIGLEVPALSGGDLGTAHRLAFLVDDGAAVHEVGGLGGSPRPSLIFFTGVDRCPDRRTAVGVAAAAPAHFLHALRTAVGVTRRFVPQEKDCRNQNGRNGCNGLHAEYSQDSDSASNSSTGGHCRLCTRGGQSEREQGELPCLAAALGLAIELAAKLLQRTSRPRAHGFNGDAKAPGNLTRRQLIEEAQHDDIPIGFVERCHDLHQLALGLEAGRDLAGGGRRFGARRRLFAAVDASFGAAPHAGEIAGDRREPRLERTRTLRRLLQRGEQRLLDDVVDFVVVEQQRARHGTDETGVGDQGIGARNGGPR